MEVRWVVGYEGKYSVSDCGKVFRNKPGRLDVRGVMAGCHKKGSVQVTLNRKSGLGLERSQFRKEYQVHRLVYEAFVGSIPPGHFVRHLNGNHDDNSLGNLYLTNHRTHWDGPYWTDDNIKEVIRLNWEGYTPEEIVSIYGGTVCSVNELARRHPEPPPVVRWSHDDVRKIRQLNSLNVNHAEILRIMGGTHRQLNALLSGKTHATIA